MEERQSELDHPFEDACQRILFVNPEAIGVAYKGLDCGCAYVCGVSARGEPVGRMQYLSGQTADTGAAAPICLICRRDDGLKTRVVREGIRWPGSRQERPDRELRIFIGQRVFGAGYTEEE